MSERRWVLGSAEDCDLRVTDDYVSAHHAVIFRHNEEGWTAVADLGSTNGTYVERNGHKTKVVGPTELLPGDVLWLGGRTSIPWRNR